MQQGLRRCPAGTRSAGLSLPATSLLLLVWDAPSDSTFLNLSRFNFSFLSTSNTNRYFPQPEGCYITHQPPEGVVLCAALVSLNEGTL